MTPLCPRNSTSTALTALGVVVVMIITIAESCCCRGVDFNGIGKVLASTAASSFRVTTTGPQTLFNHCQYCHHQRQQQPCIRQYSSFHRQWKWHKRLFALPLPLDPSFESQNIQKTNICHRRVVIVMPKYPIDVDHSSCRIEDNGSSSSSIHPSSWLLESSRHLKQISNDYQLPILDDNDYYDENCDDHRKPMEQSVTKYNDYTHYLTAVSYPRIQSYSLAIGTINPKKKNSMFMNVNHNKQYPQRNKKKNRMLSPNSDAYFVDLCPLPETGLGYRLHKNSRGGDGGGGEELLLKALGTKKLFNSVGEEKDDTPPIVIYDLTAGLARDSLVILTSYLDHWDTASLSALWQGNTPQLKLHMIERDPIVALLLADAMRRLNLLADHVVVNESHSGSEYILTEDERSIAQKMQQCLTMEEGDGVTVLYRLMESIMGDTASGVSTIRPDICYLDPMFPPRKKQKSAVKKEMAILHSLLGTAQEAVKRDETVINAGGDNNASRVLTEVERLKEEQALLLAACKLAKKRVVVKRPIGAKPLGVASSEVYDGASCDGHPSIINLADFPKPSYDVRGSVNRFDVYLIT